MAKWIHTTVWGWGWGQQASPSSCLFLSHLEWGGGARPLAPTKGTCGFNPAGGGGGGGLHRFPRLVFLPRRIGGGGGDSHLALT